MSVVSEAETDDATGKVPGTVFTARQVRILKIAVIAMGILLVGGFAFVLAAIVYQASRPAQDVKAGDAPLALGQADKAFDLRIPPGATLGGVALDGNRLALTINGEGGPEITVIDLASGKVVGRVRLSQ
jgi:predicted MFS family arabinose efflux permease